MVHGAPPRGHTQVWITDGLPRGLLQRQVGARVEGGGGWDDEQTRIAIPGMSHLIDGIHIATQRRCDIDYTLSVCDQALNNRLEIRNDMKDLALLGHAAGSDGGRVE